MSEENHLELSSSKELKNIFIEYNGYKILPFATRKRHELIEKWLNLGQENREVIAIVRNYRKNYK